jgi:hypothetical protein
MVMIAIISLAIGLVLERGQAFYENQPGASVSVTDPPSRSFAGVAGEQAESPVQIQGHSAHEVTLVAELGSLLLLAVALFGHVMPPKRRTKEARQDRIS